MPIEGAVLFELRNVLHIQDNKKTHVWLLQSILIVNTFGYFALLLIMRGIEWIFITIKTLISFPYKILSPLLKCACLEKVDMSNVGSMVDEAQRRKERLKALKGKHNTNGNEAKTSDNQPETTEKLPKYESQCLILL